MGEIFDFFGTWLAIVFMVYVGFLAVGINLLPTWLSSRTSLALMGVVVIAGGAGVF